MYSELINKVNNRRNQIRELAKNNNVLIGSDEKYIKSIKKILIIVSASRSGSSLTFDLIKRYPSIISTSGEAVPFYKLSTLSSDEQLSDEICESELSEQKKMTFFKELSEDICNYKIINDENSTSLIKSYSYRLALRFIIQWPLIEFDCKELLETISKVLYSNIDNNNFDKDIIVLNVILELRKKYPEINPYYYDIPKAKIENICKHIEKPIGPPNSSILIEEPPFIVIDPVNYINPNKFNDCFLLMKEPVTSYRLKMIKKLFNTAEFYWIHLIRNPAACINGLIDGWLDRGFFSTNIFNCTDRKVKKLNIKGYSEVGEWSGNWWNFDRPPGWQNLINKSLYEVCAFQWAVNNREIIEGLEKEKNKIIIKYEDILLSDKRRNVFNKIEKFIGSPVKLSNIMDINNLPIIQSTKKPKMYRWRDREEQILNVINASEINSIADKLGYKKDSMEEWL
ncbi:hypothetical protein AB2T96_04505 [Clostridium butyricum]|jgi:hypothetical protein|uniref:hypothetical protein n=1 Tax=Clostridium butyricum TaxID=1492 RepID=UPI00346516DE